VCARPRVVRCCRRVPGRPSGGPVRRCSYKPNNGTTSLTVKCGFDGEYEVLGDVACAAVACDPGTVGRRQPALGDGVDLLEGFDLTVFPEVPYRSNWGCVRVCAWVRAWVRGCVRVCAASRFGCDRACVANNLGVSECVRACVCGCALLCCAMDCVFGSACVWCCGAVSERTGRRSE
jgi:hypothetical protein